MKRFHIYVRTHDVQGKPYVTSAGMWMGHTAQQAVDKLREDRKNNPIRVLFNGQMGEEVARVFELVDTGDWK